MTSKLVVNTIEADTGISSVSFASSISMDSTSKFHFSAAGVDIGADTNINRPAAGVLGFNVNGAEKLRIDTNGHLNTSGIATASNFKTGSSNLHSTGLTVGNNFIHTTGINVGTGATIHVPSSNVLTLGTNSSERLRIDSSGRLLVNTTTGFAGDNTMIIAGESPSGGTYDLYDGQLLITSTETSGAVNTGGVIQFYGHDGGSSRGFGSIRCLKENGTSGNHNAYMGFLLRVNGGNPTERLRIASDGVATFSATNINVNRNAGDAFIALQTSGTSNVSLYGGATTGFRVFTKPSGGSLTERLRIQSNGRIKFIEDPVQRNSGAVDSFTGDGAYMQHYVSRNGSTYRRNLDIAAVGDGSWGCAIRFSTNPDSSATSLERMRIDHKGCITKPYQPCFSVAMSSDYTTSTTHTANFNTERFDQGNNFNTGSNGIFTAPVTGKYYMHAAIQTMQAGASQVHIMGVSFLINGSTNVSKGSGDQYLGRNGDHYITVHCIRILDLAQGDTVQVYIQLHAEVRIEGSGGSDRCNWQGYLMA